MYKGTLLKCIDNSGCLNALFLNIKKRKKNKKFFFGDIVSIIIKKQRKTIKKPTLKILHQQGFIITLKTKKRRLDGSFILFGLNSFVLINDKYKFIQTRINSIGPKEIRLKRKNFQTESLKGIFSFLSGVV